MVLLINSSMGVSFGPGSTTYMSADSFGGLVVDSDSTLSSTSSIGNISPFITGVTGDGEVEIGFSTTLTNTDTDSFGGMTAVR